MHGPWAQLKSGEDVTCDEKTFKSSKVLYISQIQQYSCMLLLSSFFIYVYNLAYIYIFWQLKHNTRSDLEKYWPDLKGKNEEFWGYEYDKHASCISPFQNHQDEYFSSTLKLAKKYNVTTMLLKAGSTYLYRLIDRDFIPKFLLLFMIEEN